MDVISMIPENECSGTIHNNSIAAFGISSQGASHKQYTPAVPCQDSHGMRWLEREEIFIAAIADGVGSCPLSHWGAYTAVQTALDTLTDGLEKMSCGKKLVFSPENTECRRAMKELMVNAFSDAQEAVENLADNAQPPQPVYALQSTLTIAVYDGSCLFHGHVGDDGIVAQLSDGTVEMATRRLKGEESSSVFPLQSGERMWTFGLVPQTAAFVMATDGVLDSFVETHPDYFGIQYFNGICYAFIEDAVYTLAKQTSDAADEALKTYQEFMDSPVFRQQVTDDLTLIAVVSRPQIARAKHPVFNLNVWNTIGLESQQARRNALNHVAAPKPAIQLPPRQQPQEEYIPEEPIPAPPPAMRQTDPEIPSGGSRFRMILVVVLCLLIGALAGILVDRFLLPKKETAQLETLQEAYEALQEQYEELIAQKEALSESIVAADAELEQVKQENEELKNALELAEAAARETEAPSAPAEEETESDEEMEEPKEAREPGKPSFAAFPFGIFNNEETGDESE